MRGYGFLLFAAILANAATPSLTLIGEQGSPETIRTPEFQMTWPRNAPIHLTGADANGIPWRVEMLLPHRRLWRITQANRPTYFFEGLTAGNGMAPSLSILALSFDSRRRPVPYYTDTLGGFSSSLLALDSESPFWVQQQWMEGNPGYRAASEEPWGYYLTSLYRFDGLYWSQTTGRHGQLAYPAFEKWDMRPTSKPAPVSAPTGYRAWLRDDSNHPVKGLRTKTNRRALGCTLDSVDVLVTDTPTGRHIRVGLTPKNIPDTAVTIFGLHRYPLSDRCTARIIWASQP